MTMTIEEIQEALEKEIEEGHNIWAIVGSVIASNESDDHKRNLIKVASDILLEDITALKICTREHCTCNRPIQSPVVASLWRQLNGRNLSDI